MSAARGMRCAAALACLLLAVVAPPFAGRAAAQMQEDYRFKGRFVDVQGKPIPEVHATLRNVDTGARIEFTSRDDGTFDRRMIPSGEYAAHFEKAGYTVREEQFHWAVRAPQVIVKVAEIVLETQGARQARELDRKSAELYRQAYAALDSNDCMTASSKAQQLLALGAGDWEYAVRFVIARCQALAGDNQAAVAEYGRVTALKPDLFEAHFDRAGVLEKLRNMDDALTEYARAAELRPNDAEVQYCIGAIHFGRQELDGAKVHLARTIAIDSTHALAHKVLGFVALQETPADPVAARRWLERYLALAPAADDGEQVRKLVQELAVMPAPKRR